MNDKHTQSIKGILTCLLFCLLHSINTEAAPVIVDQDAESISNNTSGSNYEIASGELWRTYAGSTQDANDTYQGNIIVNTGGVWRPMDSASSINVNGSLALLTGSTVDLAYKYGNTNYPNNPWNNAFALKTARVFNVRGKATIHDGVTFKMNFGGAGNRVVNDRMVFWNTALAEDTSKINITIVVNAVKHFGAVNWDTATDGLYAGNYSSFLNFINITNAEDASKIYVTSTGGYLDASLNKYKLITYVTNNTDTQGTSYALSWKAIKTELMSQGVYSAANAQLSMRNLWRIEEDLFWKRGEQIRSEERLGQSVGSDGAWAQVWRGKYDFDGVSGSKFGQTYNGIQTGYDKK